MFQITQAPWISLVLAELVAWARSPCSSRHTHSRGLGRITHDPCPVNSAADNNDVKSLFCLFWSGVISRFWIIGFLLSYVVFCSTLLAKKNQQKTRTRRAEPEQRVKRMTKVYLARRSRHNKQPRDFIDSGTANSLFTAQKNARFFRIPVSEHDPEEIGQSVLDVCHQVVVQQADKDGLKDCRYRDHQPRNNTSGIATTSASLFTTSLSGRTGALRLFAPV